MINNELREELTKLKEQFSKIEQLWDETVNKDLSKNYPFELSFDELNLEVKNWVDNIK